MHTALMIVSFVAVHCVLAGAGHAAGKETSIDARGKAAKKACILGDYKKGTEILSDLYIETNDITFVYNQARCLEQNHQWEASLDRFLEVQRKDPDLAASEKSELEQHIAECKSHLKEQDGLAPAPASSMAATPPAPAPTPAAAPTVEPDQVVTSAPRGPESDGSALRITGIALGVVGVAAVATGVVLASKTGTLSDELNKKYNQDKAATRDSYEKWGWIGYGVGAAALVTGTTLFILGLRSGKAEPSTNVSLLPVVTPSGGAVLLQGAY